MSEFANALDKDGWEDVPQDTQMTPEAVAVVGQAKRAPITYLDQLLAQGVPITYDGSGNVGPDYSRLAEKPPPSDLRGIAASFTQGTTFKWADEAHGYLLAGIDKLGGNPLPYDTLRKINQNNSLYAANNYQKENPKAGFGAEIGGGLLTALMLRNPKAISNLPAITQGAVLGAGYGGATGSGGASEGNKIVGGLTGTVLGGTVGALLAPLIPYVSTMVNKGIVTPAGKAIDTIKQFAGRSPAGIDAQSSAQRLILKGIEEGGLTPQSITQQLSTLSPEIASQTMLADTSPGLQQIGQYAASHSLAAQSMAKERLAERASNTLEKITEPALRRLIGTNKNDVIVADEVLRAGKAAAAPLYKQVDETLVPMTRDLVDMIKNNPTAMQAYKQGLFKAKSDVTWPTGIKIPSSAELKEGSTVPLRVLDLMKRSLNDTAGVALRKGANDAARNPTAIANKLTESLDQSFPFYKQARELYGDAKSFTDAIELGKKVLRTDDTVFGTELARLNATDKQGAMIGAYNAIRDKFLSAKITGNEADKLSTTLLRDRLGSVARSPEELQAFTNTLDSVSNMFETQRAIVGGSPTAIRESFNKLIDQYAPGGTLNKDSLKALPGAMINNVLKKYSTKSINQTEQFSVDLADMLTRRGPKEILPVLESLIKHQDKMTPQMREQLSRIMAAGLEQKAGEAGGNIAQKK